MSFGAPSSVRKFWVRISTALDPSNDDCSNALFIISNCVAKDSHAFAGLLCGSTYGLIDFVSHLEVAFSMLENAQWKNWRYLLFSGTDWLIALSSLARLLN